jgi:imidazolonepropionase-like amidohydrolase
MVRGVLLAILSLLPALGPQDGGGTGRAQEDGLAITNVRILTITKGEIESGTILLRGEKIAEIGKDVKVPTGFRLIDAKGMVAMPGMVNAVSRIGASDGAGGGTASTPMNTAFDEINPASDVFTQVLRTGVTAYGVHPAGGTVAGGGAVLKPVGLQKETMVIDRSAFLRITLQASTASKDALRQAFEGAKRQIEAEKKNPKPAPANPKSDDKGSPVVRFLRGEIPALVSVGGPAEVLHFLQVLDAFAEFKTNVVLVAPGDVYKAAGELGRRKSSVILRPDLTFLPFTRDRVNPAAELSRAGATVAFGPGADLGEPAESYLFRVSEMVKFGLPRDAALRAISIIPAEMLGVGKRLGSLEPGKDADVLLFDGDPLSASARLRRVFIGGLEVYSGE